MRRVCKSTCLNEFVSCDQDSLTHLRLDSERLDVVDGEHGSGDEPGESEDGADDDEDGHNEEVQVVPSLDN